jgi:exonuclease SbcC
LGENEENISKDLSKIENMKHVRNSLNEFYLIHKKLLKGREESEKLISEIKIALEKLNNGLAGFEGKKLLYRESQKIIEGMRNEMMTFEKSVSKLEAEKNSSESMLKLLEKDIEMKIKEKERAQHISELITWVDEHFINLMENIEKHVMHSIHKEFEKFFQEWFSMLMGEQLDVRIDEQFTPIIEQNGYETEYANLSGGEKTSTALAYRLALNKVVNILIDGIKTKDMLILDEPTDGFSTDQLERMRDVLDALGLGQIIIVSHEPKIDTFVENTIKIYKDGHVSRIVK